MPEIDYKKRCEEYEARMGIGENDPAKDGYIVLVKILRQQNRYLNKIEIKDMIATEEKGKASEYERAKGLWEKLPTMISGVHELRVTLKMDDEQVKEVHKSISAKSIADGDD